MQKLLFWLLITALVVIGALLVAAKDAEFETVNFQTVIKSQSSGHQFQASYLIGNQEQWNILWSKIRAGTIPREPPPEVDFNRYILLAHFMGARPSSGYEVEFVELFERGNKLYVRVLEIHPGPNCLTLTVITRPFHAIKVPRTEKQIEFMVFRTIRDCRCGTVYSTPNSQS